MKSKTSNARGTGKSQPSSSTQTSPSSTVIAERKIASGKDAKQGKPSGGKSVRSAVLAGALAFGAVAAYAPPAAAAGASHYCEQLAAQYDKAMPEQRSSARLAEANGQRERGWNECTEGKTRQGESTLKTAIRGIGAVPLAHRPEPRM